MERINKVINDLNLKNQEKTNTSTWRKPTKYKETCIICGKEFEFEDTPKERWIKPKRYFCSDKCKSAHDEKVYRERLTIIPIKFRDIECDKPNIVKKGINQSMFITGGAGVGKTVLMAGIVKEILKNREKEVKWISYSGFIMELQSLFRKDDEITPFERAEEIASFPGALAIDDIGAEKITAFVQQITYYIINHREQEMLHTLITSNFSLQQIDDQIDTRVSSRIGGMCQIVRLTGKDRRLQK